MKKILMIFGTRPEAIKLAPVYLEVKKHPQYFDVKVCVTGQHRQMLDQVLELFDITPDFDLNIMKKNQDLFDITSNALMGLREVIRTLRPDLVIVHGDTTTTMAASIAGFYERVSVAHVEAGLRTYNLSAPWPEEFNRRVATIVASIHFAPTELSKQNLLKEGVPDHNIQVTGNTVIDALIATVEKIRSNQTLQSSLERNFPFFKNEGKFLLLTGHRRENIGSGFDDIFAAVNEVVERCEDVFIVYPVHLNPSVREPAEKSLKNQIERGRVFLIEPQDYISFTYLMMQSDLIITDSGGVQEEAPQLGIPVLVTRNVTERPEAVEAGTAILTGSSRSRIVEESLKALKLAAIDRPMKKNPYGDGRAAERIVEALRQFFQI